MWWGKRVRDRCGVRGTWLVIADFEGGGRELQAKEGSRDFISTTARTWILNGLMRTEWAGKRVPSYSLQEETQPWGQLGLSPWRPRGFWPRNLCDNQSVLFKPLNLWWLVMRSIENKYTAWSSNPVLGYFPQRSGMFTHKPINKFHFF